MKKIFLLVASILATLHSIASRSSNDSNNPLILSPSDGIYNHGSHGSHASHCSHYSMSITIKKDSTRNVNKDVRNFIIQSLASKHNCKVTDIDVMDMYVTKNNEIVTKEKGASSISRYKPSSNEECLFISFRKWNRGAYPSFNIHEYIIPLANNVANYFHISEGHHYHSEKKEKWMTDLNMKLK